MEGTYTFVQLLVLIIARSLQVSVPILLIMKLRHVAWTDYGFVRFRPVRDVLVAIGLTAAGYFAYYTAAILLHNVGFDFSGDFDAIPQITTEASISLVTITLIMMASVANGFAEELAMRSYLLTRLADLFGSKIVAVVATSVLFAAYHSYQGRHGVFSALMIGVVFGIYFAKTNRFWPVMIAHFIMDAFPLTLIAAGAE